MYSECGDSVAAVLKVDMTTSQEWSCFSEIHTHSQPVQSNSTEKVSELMREYKSRNLLKKKLKKNSKYKCEKNCRFIAACKAYRSRDVNKERFQNRRPRTWPLLPRPRSLFPRGLFETHGMLLAGRH